jgi:hypothetical protein
MVSAHVCGILATRARQVFFDGTDGSDGRLGETLPFLYHRRTVPMIANIPITIGTCSNLSSSYREPHRILIKKG